MSSTQLLTPQDSPQDDENNLQQKWREITNTAEGETTSHYNEEMLTLKEREIEELRNVILSQQLVHSVQQRALIRHCNEKHQELETLHASKSHDFSRQIQQLERELNKLNEHHSLLLVEKSFSSAKVLDLEHQLTSLRQRAADEMEKIELENQLKIEQVTERLTIEHKETLNMLVETYHKQISELQLEHDNTLTILEEKFCQQREKREHELEATVYEELSQVGQEIEKRMAALELDQKEREAQFTDEIRHLKVELQREGESHLKEKKALLHEIQTIKDTMASEKAAMSKAHKKEYERIKKEHQAQIQQVKAQLQTATQLAERHHMEDNQTLQALHTNLQQVQHEKDTLQSALMSLYSSVTSLLPFADEGSESRLTPPTTQWTTPTHKGVNMTTPISNPSDLFPKTLSTEDSGLASQQTSAGRAPPLSLNSRSVLQTLRPQQDATPIGNVITTPTNVNLSISQLHDDEPEGSDNLTIFSLDSSMEAPPTWDLIELDPPMSHSIQAMVTKLYQSVSHLVNSFLSSSTQVSQYQHELVQAQEDLVRSQTDLNNQLKCVEELQTKVHSLQSDLVKHERKEENLKSAEDKISLLISEIEILRQKSEEQRHILAKQQEDAQLNGMIAILKEEKNKLTRQVSTLEKELLLSQKERDAQRDAIHNLQENTERTQLQYRQEVEALKVKERKLTNQVKQRESHIRELEDLPGQLTAKQQKEEELQETIKQLTSQLTSALHQSALADSATSLKQQIDNYQQQVEKQKERYDNLLKTYEGTVASLTCASEELDREKTTKEKLQKELMSVKKQLEMKDSDIEQLISIKDEAQDQCNQLHEQISTLTSQVDSLTAGLKTSTEQVSKLCHSLEEKDNLVEEMSQSQAVNQRQVEELQEEANHHLKAFEQSVLQVQTLKDELEQLKELLTCEKEALNSMKATKASVEKEIVSIRDQLVERENHHHVEVKNLHAEFCLKEQEIKRLHRQELQDLEDKLQVEHAGQQALLKLQLNELSASTADSRILQKIAEITPTLEQNAQDVLKLCQGENSLLEQLQQQSNETIKSLNETNKSLRHDISLAENSMQLANATLTSLQNELEEFKKREITLQKQLENQSSEMEHKLQDTQRNYEKRLESLKQEGERKFEKVSDSHQQLAQSYKTLESSSQQREEELQKGYQLLQKELEIAHSQSIQSNVALEENMKLVQKLMQQLEDVKSGESQSQQIQTLRHALENKENELSQTVNEFLEEKLKVAKLRGEKSSLQSRLSSPEKLQTLDGNMRERFEQEKASLLAALESAEAKIHRLSAIARSNDRRCKSLVFQKRYLSSELDAFYHTHHAALIMIQDMGGIPWQPPPRYHGKGVSFKRIALAVLAAVRLRLLTSKRRIRRMKGGGHIPVANQIVHSVY